MNYKFNISAFLFLALCASIVFAQDKPFWDEIQKFKQQDSQQAPPKNAILFIGSSSFRLWDNVQSYFPSKTIINRGFGGSGLKDVVLYADDIIFPYRPRQIVIYCGENDIADNKSAEDTFEMFKELFSLIRKKRPDVSIAFISIKPSPRRRKFLPEVVKTNALVQKYLSKQSNTTFIDVYHPMLMASGEPIPEIFTEDSLHMNRKGYAIWQKVIEPHLLK